MIYISRSRLAAPVGEALTTLQAQTDASYPKLGITGLLDYNAGNSRRIIEGDAAVIERLYGKIRGDVRHSDFCRLSSQTIERRRFEEWDMAFMKLEGASTFEMRAFETLLQTRRRDCRIHVTPTRVAEHSLTEGRRARPSPTCNLGGAYGNSPRNPHP